MIGSLRAGWLPCILRLGVRRTSPHGRFKFAPGDWTIYMEENLSERHLYLWVACFPTCKSLVCISYFETIKSHVSTFMNWKEECRKLPQREKRSKLIEDRPQSKKRIDFSQLANIGESSQQGDVEPQAVVEVEDEVIVSCYHLVIGADLEEMAIAMQEQKSQRFDAAICYCSFISCTRWTYSLQFRSHYLLARRS